MMDEDGRREEQRCKTIVVPHPTPTENIGGGTGLQFIYNSQETYLLNGVAALVSARFATKPVWVW